MKLYRGVGLPRVAQILLVILVLVLVLELLSKSVLYVIVGIKDSDYAHYYQEDPNLNLLTWTESYTPHPYFGYESPTTKTSEVILSEVGDTDFVIGILGGSVAGSFAEYAIRHPHHFESFREVIPGFGARHLRIVNLANGGFKQPQQFFVAAYFLEKLDLIINLDGLNDATSAHLLPVYPLEFPVMPQVLSRTSAGGVYVTIGRTTRWVYKNMTHAPSALPGLSRSSSYFMVWYYLHDLLYRVVRGSESAYYANEFEVHQSDALRKTPSKDFVQKRIAIWKKYTVLEDGLVRRQQGKPLFFFLQPNQYLKNSKRFSEQEKRGVVDPSRLESTHERMILLKVAAQDLRRLDVPMVDLTAVFSETEKTVYIDDCCHLNDLGNQIMADAVADNIRLYQAKAGR